MAENKVTFGLQGVHIAFVTPTSTDALPAWDKPISVPGAVRITPTAVGDESSFYADNTVYFRITANNGYTLEAEFANLPDAVKARMFGWVIDDNGALVEVTNGIATPFAMLFQIEGDVHARRAIYYKCTASRPAKERTTKAETVTPTTDVISITATPINLDDRMVTMLDLPAGSAAYDAFYDAVYTPVITTDDEGGAA